MEPHLAVATDLLGGPVTRATADLLVTATRGDPVLLGLLVAAGQAVGALSQHLGQWHWTGTAHLARLVESAVDTNDQGQLEAWETLTRPLGEPHQVVTRIRRGGPCLADLGITPRELDVLLLLSDGLTADAMARRLGLSARTVTKHQERLYRKLGTTDRLTTVLKAQRLGIVTS